MASVDLTDAADSGLSLNAYGLSVPLDLEDGKTYVVSAKRRSNSGHIAYVLKYAKGDNYMWTYESFAQLAYKGHENDGDVYGHTFTAEVGKGYALFFALTANDNNVPCEFTNISVVEVE